MTIANDGSISCVNNISAPNLTGLSFNSNYNLQTTSYTTATILTNHLQVNLPSGTYGLGGIRAYISTLADLEETMITTGRDHTKAISFVYKYSTTAADCQYRLDFAGRSAYSVLYGSTKTEHSIQGNLTV